MPRLYDVSDNSLIGHISREDLDLLVAQLEETSRGDRDYFVNNDTFLALVEAGASATLLDAIKVALDRNPGLADRLFTPAELTLPSGARRGPASLAARFAAKEAVAKSLGAPGGLRWHDAEIRTDPSGRPTLRVRGSVSAAAARQGIRSWHLSLTHDADVASAVVIASS